MIPDTWHTKFTIPPTLPTLLRGAINAGIDQPTGAEAERPPIDRPIHSSARIAVCAWAAPKMPSPHAVPATSTTLRTSGAFHPRETSPSTSKPPMNRSVAVAKSHGAPVYRKECSRSMCKAPER